MTKNLCEMSKKLEPTIERAQREELEKAADDVIRRVLMLAQSREADLGEDKPVDSLDFALLAIRYGSFLDEGFFKLLRNTNFMRALGVSMVIGFATWVILNIMTLGR